MSPSITPFPVLTALAQENGLRHRRCWSGRWGTCGKNSSGADWPAVSCMQNNCGISSLPLIIHQIVMRVKHFGRTRKGHWLHPEGIFGAGDMVPSPTSHDPTYPRRRLENRQRMVPIIGSEIRGGAGSFPDPPSTSSRMARTPQRSKGRAGSSPVRGMQKEGLARPPFYYAQPPCVAFRHAT